MQLMETVRLNLRNHVCIPLTCKHRGNKLLNKNFTIISNNCWAGTVYEAYNLPKQSPTVGLFFMAHDYIKFLQNLSLYINCPLIFINPFDSKWASWEREIGNDKFGHYPVGVLKLPGERFEEGIEIFFLHYNSEQEAKDKWERRCKRINWDRILIKFNDQNGCTEKEIKDFDTLPYKDKICFSVRKYPQYKSVITIKAPKSHKYIRASYEPFGERKSINITNMLNNIGK